MKLPFKWMLRRSRPENTAVLDTRRIYIIPTRQGLLFSFFLLLMFTSSINYNLSLGFALVFLLSSMTVTSILHTFNNLLGLKISPLRSPPVFAGEPARFFVSLENAEKNPRKDIRIRLAEEEKIPSIGREASASFSIPSEKRGRLYPGRFTLYSTYPLNLFRAWSYVDLDMNCLVYPRPEKSDALSTGQSDASGQKGIQSASGRDDFSGLRSYQKGDPLKHISWKALAREKGMHTKEFFENQGGERIWLDWENLPGIPQESRLSRLCRMVLDADSSGIFYGLKLPGKTIEINRGEEHRHQCLEALALFGTEE